MTEASSSSSEAKGGRSIFGWLLFPIALFPLVALLTYDWRSVPSLKIPADPSTNWIGPLGDTFAYVGYQLVGLAVWIVPVVCIIVALFLVAGRRILHFRRTMWFLVLLSASACLLQVAQEHAPGISSAISHVNIANAGGAVGYLVMTRFLSPLISDFGASVLMVIIVLVSLVAGIGLANIASFFASLYRWATMGGHIAPNPETAGSKEEYERQLAAYEAAVQAREAAKEQARLEKEQAKAEKERIRAEKEAEKERLRAEKEAEKERLRAEKAERAATALRPQVQQPAPAAKPAPAPEESGEEEEPPVEDKGPYILPSLSLLNPLKTTMADHSDVGEMSQKLVDTLKLFDVNATLAYTVQGPVVTKYALTPEPGTRPEKFTSLQATLMMALKAKSLRIEAPIPGEDKIGIEVPNRRPAGISFREIFESDAWRESKAELPLLFGKRADGKELVADLASMPHMLVAGATGQGKSVCLNSLICGLLMTRTPEQLKLIMVDPKCVEFTPYSAIPHLLVPVITDNRKVVFSLHWAVAEMEKRLKLFARARVRNIYDFNHRTTFSQPDMFGGGDTATSDMPKTVPYIVIISADHHRRDQGEHPGTRRVQDRLRRRLAHDPRRLRRGEPHRQGRHALPRQGRTPRARPGRVDLGRRDRQHHELHPGALEPPVRRDLRKEARTRQGGVDRRPLRVQRGRSRQPEAGGERTLRARAGEGERGRGPLQARPRVHHQHEPRVGLALPAQARDRIQPRREALRQARGRGRHRSAAGRGAASDHHGPAAASRDLQRRLCSRRGDDPGCRVGG